MVSPFFWGGRGGANLCRQLETTVEIRGGWDLNRSSSPKFGGGGLNQLNNNREFERDLSILLPQAWGRGAESTQQ